MGTPYVIVADPDAVKEVLVDKEAAFPKPQRLCTSMAEMLNPEAKEGVLTCPAAGTMWRTVRKALSHSFSENEIREDFEVSKAKALILVNELAQMGPGVVVDMDDACTRLSLDALGVAKLNYDFQAVETEDEVMMLKLLKECLAEWAARQHSPYRAWLWWANDSYAEGRQKYHILQAFISQLWASLRKRGPPVEADVTAAAQLTRIRDPKTAKPVPDSVPLAELGSLLLAGGMAPGHVTAYALKLLAQHPHVQEALYAELLQQGLVNRPDLLTMDTVGLVPLLDAVVREALRLYPAFGDGLVREAADDTQLLGRFTIPKGVRVWVYPYAMHRSSKLWQDGDAFDPSRWQPFKEGEAFDGMVTATDASTSAAAIMQPGGHTKGKGTKEAAGGSRDKKKDKAGKDGSGAGTSGTSEALPRRLCPPAFMPFGMGQRACLGQVFAQAQLKAALGILVAFFKFELAVEEGEGYSEEVGLHLAPSAGIPLTLSLRNPEILQG